MLNSQIYLGFTFSVSPLLMSALFTTESYTLHLILFSYIPSKQSQTENSNLKGILNVWQIIIKSYSFPFFFFSV